LRVPAKKRRKAENENCPVVKKRAKARPWVEKGGEPMGKSRGERLEIETGGERSATIICGK